ncbi:mRNA cleavage and polyadenylation factor II complex, subunit CFT2 [Pseudoloma neurophilia]|uniref:Cleavage and polyadenylation specificity factor subunit 2 n=1 Tax=Pseudoloma neurophilia TaxID=146866 RepID=A0A0R0LZC7_9MICR|nr:mRNA cleavage and polyadenylation factor II complex, subunit CFT2 [Pseudoloma neurophilia]
MGIKSFYSLQAISPIHTDVYCQLLEIDSYRILINCGSNEKLQVEYFEKLEEILPKIDCIIISHAELKYFGGILHVFKKQKTKIIMALPIHAFSKIIFQEILQNIKIRNESSDIMTENDISVYNTSDLDKNILEELYDFITIVKFSQPLEIGTLRLVAKNAGHSLGGSLWQIQKDSDIITVAIDINHKKENHIDGCNLTNIKKSFLFITNCDFVGECPFPRKEKEKIFFNILKKDKDRKIIFVCDFMRSLEICCVINEFFATRKFDKECAYLSFNSKSVHEKFKGFLEWTGDIALQKFTNEKTNPFKFDKIHFVESFNSIPKDTNFFVIPNDGNNSVFLDRLIYENNERKNLLIFLNEDLEFSQIQNNSTVASVLKEERRPVNVPIFMTVDQIENPQPELLSKPGHRSFIEEAPFLNRNEKFQKEKKKKLVFPMRNQSKPRDLYGEFFDRTIVQTEEEFQPVVEQDEPEIKPEEKKEIVKMTDQTFIPEISTRFVNFKGLIDGNAMKDILESVDIEKMILFGKDRVFVNFFRDRCLLTKCIKETVVLDTQKVNLSSDTLISRVDLEENFLEDVGLQQFGNLHISPFIGSIKENLLIYDRPLTKDFCFGLLNFKKLQTALLDKNFKVRKLNENSIIIDESVTIEKKDNKYYISADYSNKYVFIRNIIYQNIVFIE